MESKNQFVGLVAVIVVGDFDNILASLAINSYRLGAASKSCGLPTASRALSGVRGSSRAWPRSSSGDYSHNCRSCCYATTVAAARDTLRAAPSFLRDCDWES